MSGMRIPRRPALLAGLLLGLVLSPLHAADAPKPTFIVISIDDLGYADIRPFGSKLNRTTHPGRMAAEGRKLTYFYTAPAGAPWTAFPIWNR